MGPAGRTARAKGLAEARMVPGHAMQSALTPVVSQLGIDVGPLIIGFVLAAACSSSWPTFSWTSPTPCSTAASG
jgi:ABC-type antimicrobial peptide transport system permease subunit